MEYNCPFCQMKMLHTSVSTFNAYYCTKCKHGSFYKYVITFLGHDHLHEILIILSYDNNDYLLKICRDVTSLYKLTKKGSDLIMNVSYSFIIDIIDPINSGLSILSRLLNLNAFS